MIYIKHSLWVLPVLYLMGCATLKNLATTPSQIYPDSQAVLSALQNPPKSNQTARVRVYSTSEEEVMIIENGKKHRIEFNHANTDNISIGMPITKQHLNKIKNNIAFKEYVVTAGVPIILGFTPSKFCHGSVFSACKIHIFQRYFIPEAGKDYEITNLFHVGEISSDLQSKEILIDMEIVKTSKERFIPSPNSPY